MSGSSYCSRHALGLWGTEVPTQTKYWSFTAGLMLAPRMGGRSFNCVFAASEDSFPKLTALACTQLCLTCFSSELNFSFIFNSDPESASHELTLSRFVKGACARLRLWTTPASGGHGELQTEF